mmetsp:Transcript_33380/g.80765  ORF Transcript_33380/g.80765 Transcript_33380/m.80765 type:complete len:794 (-) Transcript_33380:49-2430(-)
MTDSENHRPAVSLKQSPEAYISKRLEEAADLEQKLKASKKAEISAEIQSRLCEVFGDILISDPLAAKRNNVADRLWNTCFYRNISQLRSKISRAKRHKDSKGVRIMTKEFDSHCAGGIKLYEFLESHFRDKILSQTNQSQTQDSGTQDSSVDSVEGISKSIEGVVEIFARVYIYLGDLHRYGEKFNKAEECYYNAVKLAPGKGNPYNQLAVVTQTKDPKMSCNALHWYCRSILATHQSFNTSPDNLQRLFDTNKGYLNEHSRNPKPPIYKKPEQKPKGSSELVRATQQAATKSCLAHFVDVFYVIVESRKPNDADANEVDEEAIRSKMSDVMASFESLLQVAAFSDALLFKLVQICAFVYEICRTMTPISKELSRDFLLMTGTTLAIPMNVILSRILAKGRGGSFRYLLPYQILCEYLSQIEESEGKEHDIFWKSFSEIASLILKLSIRDGVAPNSYVLDGDINVPLKEYQQLRGYRPFNFLYKSYAEGNPYISPEDAIDALDLLTSKASQEYVRSSALDINTTKAARFLAMCEEYAENEKFPVSFSGDRYVFVEKPVRDEAQDEPFDGADFEGSAPAVVDEDDDDDAGDVVLFTGEEKDGSDASATMQVQPPAASPRNPYVADNGDSETTHVAPAAEVLPPPAALLPPPGFTAPMGNQVNNQVRNPLPPVPPQQYPHPGVYGQVVQGHQMLPTPPPPAMALPGTAPLQGLPVAGINGNVPFGQAWQVFGGASSNMQSANPFATAMPIGFGHAKPATPMFEDQHITTEGTSLLDSALIDSLFMNDTKTNNPWK